MKKVIVIGANGMLGHAVTEYFGYIGYRVEPITRQVFDIARDSIEKLDVFFKGADFVINCAGVIKSRISNVSIEDVLKVNSNFPKDLARLCNINEIPCFHISTDCVFSGKRGLYTEYDYCDAEDVYGLSKYAGDTSDCMVLRTSIIGEKASDPSGLLEWFRNEREHTVNGFVNHLWNGITTVYFAEVIKDILDLGLYEHGIFHIFSDKVVSKFELLSLINIIYRLDIKIKKLETDNPCNRSLSSKKDLCSIIVRKPLGTQISEMERFWSK
jgi:dTDP-4-dehydrorhamnose reductase